MVETKSVQQQLQQLVFHQGIEYTQNPYSKSVLQQLSDCHTARQGMHQLHCQDLHCGYRQFQYHNCGNRHCPNCGGMKRQQWLEDKTTELLPTAYYHVVFTIPHELNGLIMGNRKLLFDLLFEASSYTLLTLAKDGQWLGATPGIISILHTWGQDLSFHPHVHCIVSGGGVQEHAINKTMSWVKEKRKNHNYLFPKPAMQKVFKGYYLQRIRKLLSKEQLHTKDKAATQHLLKEIGYKRWNVYAKRPFGGPLQVLEYLGRYTHKVAITTHRIKHIDSQQQTICFGYKDYRKRGTDKEQQEMTLSIREFNRRFEQHILPKRYVKIRHYGYLRNHKRAERLQQLFALLQLPPPPPKVQIPASQRMLEQYGKDIGKCPNCEHGRLEKVATYYRGVLAKTYETELPRNKAPSV